MIFIFRVRPRFTLRALLLLVAVVSVLLGWRAWSREEAKRVAGLRDRERYARDVLMHASGHLAVRDNELLREARLHVASDRLSQRRLQPGQFTLEADFHCSSISHRRPEWPVSEVKKAVLSSLVEAVTDMDVFSSIDITTVTPDCAVMAGDEGWIVWKFAGLEKGWLSPSVSPMHSLRLEFTCRGRLTYDEPLAEVPKLYKLGIHPELALHSEDPDDRLAGAAHISVLQSPAHAEAVLAAIDRETNPKVLARLFAALEVEYPGHYDPGSLVVARLREMLERDDPHASLAARTLLGGDHLFKLFEAQHDGWNAAALRLIRQAGIEILQNGSKEDTQNAVRELRRQMTEDDREAVEAIVAAVHRGHSQGRADVEIFQALRGNPHAVDPLVSLLRESDRPEAWYPAARILRSSAGHVDADGQKIGERLRSLMEQPQHRLQVAGSYTRGYEDEFNALGDDAFEFLVALLEFRIWENIPSLYSRAADMLAKLADRRAVPVLVLAVEDHFRHGNLDSDHTAFGAAQLVKAINELTGENFGGLGLGPEVSGDEVAACDWAEIRRALAAYVGQAHDGPQ